MPNDPLGILQQGSSKDPLGILSQEPSQDPLGILGKPQPSLIDRGISAIGNAFNAVRNYGTPDEVTPQVKPKELAQAEFELAQKNSGGLTLEPVTTTPETGGVSQLPQTSITDQSPEVVQKRENMQRFLDLTDATVKGLFYQPTANIVEGAKTTVKGFGQIGEGIVKGDLKKGARGAVDVALGGATTVFSAMPPMYLANMGIGAASPLTEEIGAEVGGEAGREVAKRITGIAGVMPFGKIMTLASIASQAGEEGVRYAIEDWKIPQEDKDRILGLTGHLGFFGTLIGGNAVSGRMGAKTDAKLVTEGKAKKTQPKKPLPITDTERIKLAELDKQFESRPETQPSQIPILEKGVQAEVPSIMVDAKGEPIPLQSVTQAQGVLNDAGKRVLPFEDIQKTVPTPTLENLPTWKPEVTPKADVNENVRTAMESAQPIKIEVKPVVGVIADKIVNGTDVLTPTERQYWKKNAQVVNDAITRLNDKVVESTTQAEKVAPATPEVAKTPTVEPISGTKEPLPEFLRNKDGDTNSAEIFGKNNPDRIPDLETRRQVNLAKSKELEAQKDWNGASEYSQRASLDNEAITAAKNPERPTTTEKLKAEFEQKNTQRLADEAKIQADRERMIEEAKAKVSSQTESVQELRTEVKSEQGRPQKEINQSLVDQLQKAKNIREQVIRESGNNIDDAYVKQVYDMGDFNDKTAQRLKEAGFEVGEGGAYTIRTPEGGEYRQVTGMEVDRLKQAKGLNRSPRELPPISKTSNKYAESIASAIKDVKNNKEEIARIEALKQPKIQKSEVEGADWYRQYDDGFKEYYKTVPVKQSEVPNAHRKTGSGQALSVQKYVDGKWIDEGDYFYPEGSSYRSKTEPYSVSSNSIPTSAIGAERLRQAISTERAKLSTLKTDLANKSDLVKKGGFGTNLLSIASLALSATPNSMLPFDDETNKKIRALGMMVGAVGIMKMAGNLNPTGKAILAGLEKSGKPLVKSIKDFMKSGEFEGLVKSGELKESDVKIFGDLAKQPKLEIVNREVRKIAKEQEIIQNRAEHVDALKEVVNKSAESTPEESVKETQSAVKDYLDNSDMPQSKKNKINEIVDSPTVKESIRKSSEQSVIAQKMESVWVGMRETFEDNWIRVKRMLHESDADISSDLDPYLRKELYVGRVKDKSEKIFDNVRSIDKDRLDISKQYDVPDAEVIKNVNEYLRSKHTPERNAIHGEGASGITSKQALDNINKIESLPYSSEVKRIAKQIQDLSARGLEILKDGQLITPEQYQTLKTQYPNHVPLNRILEENMDVLEYLSGKGLDVKSSGMMRAKGSDLQVSDILGNVTNNIQKFTIRAEKNLVDLSILDFARKHAAEGMFTEIKPQPIGKGFDGRIIYKQITDPNVLQLRENGKPIYLKIKDDALAQAIRGVNDQQLPTFLKFIRTFTGISRGLATMYNPEFPFSNKIRDLQELVVTAAAQKELGFSGAAGTLAKDPSSMKAVTDFYRGINNEGTRLYKQLKADGGTTGGIAISSRSQVDAKIEDIMKLNRSKKRQAAYTALKTIDNLNAIFEDSSRLSVYREALSKGYSRSRAAFLAKNATINFDRHGTASPIVNAFYMFANASVQGSAKMLRAMKNPKVAAATVASIGGAVAVANNWNDNIDPDWRKKVSDYDRQSNLVVVLSKDGGGVKYITVPVSWGLKPIKVAADAVYDLAIGQGLAPLKTAEKLITSVIEAYNPVGGTDIISAISPTILDVPIDLARGRSWTGALIKPLAYGNPPEHLRYFKDFGKSPTESMAKATTDQLANIGIEISPADMVYAFNQYIGGTGRFTSKTISTVSSVGRGEAPTVRDIPFVSRFYKSIDKEQAQSRMQRIERMQSGNTSTSTEESPYIGKYGGSAKKQSYGGKYP